MKTNPLPTHDESRHCQSQAVSGMQNYVNTYLILHSVMLNKSVLNYSSHFSSLFQDFFSAIVQKDNGEKTEMVWARHEDGRRSRSEESDDESDTGEKEERETKDKVEGCVQEGHADCRTERGRCRRQGLLERDDQQP